MAVRANDQSSYLDIPAPPAPRAQPGRVVASAELWNRAWPADAAFKPESLHIHIYRLRRLTLHGLRIESMVGVGYRLAAAGGCAR